MAIPYEENSYEDTKRGDVTTFMHEYVDGSIYVVTRVTMKNCTYLDNECVDFTKGDDNVLGSLFEVLIIVGLVIIGLFTL